MADYSNSSPVFVHRCEDYNEERLYLILKESFDALGIGRAAFDGKKVLLKPNLVMAKNPDAAATTHPAVLEAILRILSGRAAEIVIAESPGGLFNRQRLEGIYRTCGIAEVAERHGVRPEDCTVFDDSLSACKGARAARMRVVGVYDSYFAADEREMRRFCDIYIKGFEELLYSPTEKASMAGKK